MLTDFFFWEKVLMLIDLTASVLFRKACSTFNQKYIYKIKKEEKKKKRHALQGLSYALLSYTNFFVLLLGGLCRISLPLKIGLLIGGIEVITFVFSAGKNWVRYHLLYFLGANHVVKPKACMVRQLSKVNNCSHCTLFYLLKHRPAGCSSW